METTGVIAGVTALSLGAISSFQHVLSGRSRDKETKSTNEVVSMLIAYIMHQDERIKALESVVQQGGGQQMRQQQPPQQHGSGQVVNRISIVEGELNSLSLRVRELENDVDGLMSVEQAPVVSQPQARAAPKPVVKPPPPKRAARAQPPKPASARRARPSQTPVVTDDESVYGDDDDSEFFNAVSR